MRVLLAAALANLQRLTPHNIASSVWALSKLAGQGSGHSIDQGISLQETPSTSSTGAQSDDAARNHNLGSAATLSTDEGLGDTEGLGDDPSRPTAPSSPAVQSIEAATLQLLQGLASVTGARASEFKPAHVGDALWGFGSLGMHPGDAALGGLLDAASAAGPSGFKGSNGACALIGLGRLIAAHPDTLRAQCILPGPTPVVAAVDEATDVDSISREVVESSARAQEGTVAGEMREHPALGLLAEVVGTAGPHLALERLAEVNSPIAKDPGLEAIITGITIIRTVVLL